VSKIVCRHCGRELFATAPIASLFADERRCPRCAMPMDADRRAGQRRKVERRDPRAAAGPPATDAGGDPARDPRPEGEARAAERRRGERRVVRRRRADQDPFLRGGGRTGS
jgi:hypothetical protein